LAVVGAGVVLGPDSLNGESMGIGAFYGMLAGFFYGIFFLFAQPARKHLDSLRFFWISTTASAVVLLTVVGILRQPLIGYSLQTNLLFLAMGIFSQAVGWLLVNYTQGHLPASVVSPTLLGQPVVTALLAGPLLKETLSGWETAGGVAVLVGIYLIHISRTPKTES
jgi:drug/metabolite transporter (DMT)-like permease